MTVTPVLYSFLLPRLKQLAHGESPLVAWSFTRAKGLVGVALAAASVPLFLRAFLPAFNEGSLAPGMLFNPGAAHRARQAG